MQTDIRLLAGLGLAMFGTAASTQDVGDIEIQWFSFAQLTAEHLAGDGGVRFGADRLRFGSLATHRRLSGAMQLDLGAGDLSDSLPGTFANVIKDLYVSYELGGDHDIQLGQFKAPLGMDFNISGDALDITKRGMEAGLVLERSIGIMVSARRWGGAFGYDVGYFNVAGRSGATAYLESQEGMDNAFAARGLYESGRWHAELAYGQTSEAGGPGTADYRVTDLGIGYGGEGWAAKAEWIEGRGVRGDPSRTERVYYLHGGRRVGERFELVARHYAGTSWIGGASTGLHNTFVGFTWHPTVVERMGGRVQFNHVIAGGGRAGYTGVAGYRDDAILVQFRLNVEK